MRYYLLLSLCTSMGVSAVALESGTTNSALDLNQTQLLQKLGTGSTAERVESLRLLLRLDSQSQGAFLQGYEKQATRSLAELVRNSDPKVQECAMYVLHRMLLRNQQGAAEAVRAVETNLISALSSPLSSARQEAALLLGQSAPPATNVVPQLLKQASIEPDGLVRNVLLEVAGLMGKSDPSVAEELLAMALQGRQNSYSAIRALRFHEGSGQRIVSALLPLTQSTNFVIADAALQAIDSIVFREHVPQEELTRAIMNILQTEDVPQNVKMRCVSVVGKLIGRDSDVATRLLQVTRSNSPPEPLYLGFLQALGYAKTPSQAVLEYVHAAAESASEPVRSRAAQTLKELQTPK